MWAGRYTAIRYNNIRGEINPPGTTENPIIIDSDSFPYTNAGNTRDVVSMQFDRYSVAPEMNQQGPEVIYQLRLRLPGAVSIRVSDIKNEGIDNDIHLLSSLQWSDRFEALDCIARGDHEIVANLDADTYYLVIDSGKDMPGEYTLTVDSSPH